MNDPEHSLRFSWLLLSQIIVCSQKQHVVESGLSEAEGTIDFLIRYLSCVDYMRLVSATNRTLFFCQ